MSSEHTESSKKQPLQVVRLQSGQRKDILREKLWPECAGNEPLYSDLARLVMRCHSEYDTRKPVAKALKKALPAIKQLKEAGWTGWDAVDGLPLVDHLLHLFELEQNHVLLFSGINNFRDYLCARVMGAMREHGIPPTSYESGPFCKLTAVVFEACGEPAGDMRRRILRILKKNTK